MQIVKLIFIIFFLIPVYKCIFFNSNYHKSDESTTLINILKFSYNSFPCISFFKDNFEQKNEFYKALFQSGIPLILNESQQYCQGHLIVAKDLETLPSIITNSRKYYDDRLVCYLFDNSKNVLSFLESNNKIFGEAEVLIATESESYKLDPFSRTVNSIVIDSTQNWEKYKPIYNFMGRKFKVGSFNIPMFVDFGTLDSFGNPQYIKGIELKAFSIIANMVNISWSIATPSNELDKWGGQYPNGSWPPSGIFGMLQSGEVDIIMACIFLKSNLYGPFSVSMPTNTVVLRHLVKRPRLLNAGWSSIFRPLPLSVWILTLLELLLHSFFMSCITRLKSKLDEKFIFTEYSYFSTNIFHSLGILVLSAIPSSTKEYGPLRHLINSWVITCFLVMTCFGSSLVSHLTTPDLENQPETIKDLCMEGYYWGKKFKSNNSFYLNFNNPWHKIWDDRFIVVKNPEHHMELLRSNKFVVWGKSVDKIGVIVNEVYLHGDTLSDWEASNEEITTFYYTYVTQWQSPLILAVNRCMLLLAQTGHINKFIKDEFMQKNRQFMRDFFVKTKPRSVATVLALNNFQGIFYLYLGGLVLSTLCFILELYFFKHLEN